MPRRTVARSAELRGTGLFSGRSCAVRVEPGQAGAGLRLRVGDAAIPVNAAHRIPAARRTTLAGDGIRVDTVEHLLAAISAAGIDDLDLIVAEGEIPIGDGSFQPFVDLLLDAGTHDAVAPRRIMTVGQELRVTVDEASYLVAPADELIVDVTLEYRQPIIGRQRVCVTLTKFVRMIAGARTFGFVADIQRAQQHGELLGATTDAGIALEADRVVNTMLRWPDEPVRHKAGDLIGDLMLLGAPLRARVTAIRPSHEGNVACVRAILDAARIQEE